MKKLTLTLVTLAAALTLTNSALAQEASGHVCGEQSPTASAAVASNVAEVVTPEAVVQAFITAVNAGDQAATFALVSPDTCIQYGTGTCISAERLERWWQSDIFGPQGQITADELVTDGDTVTLTGQYNSNGWSGRANYVFTVADGLITGWSMR